MMIAYLSFLVGAYTIWQGIRKWQDIRKIKRMGKKHAARISAIGNAKDSIYYKITFEDETGVHEVRYDLQKSVKKRDIKRVGDAVVVYTLGNYIHVEDKGLEFSTVAMYIAIGVVVFIMGIASLREKMAGG